MASLASLGCHGFLENSFLTRYLLLLVVCSLLLKVIDRSRDPFYFGDVQVMIVNVPLKTDNNQVEVLPRAGTLEETHSIDRVKQSSLIDSA